MLVPVPMPERVSITATRNSGGFETMMTVLVGMVVSFLLIAPVAGLIVGLSLWRAPVGALVAPVGPVVGLALAFVGIRLGASRLEDRVPETFAKLSEVT